MEEKIQKSTLEKVQVVKPTQKEKSATTPAQEVKKLSLSELLDKQLIEIKRKKKLIDRRDIFIQKNQELENCLAELNQEQADGSFATESFSLVFAKKNGYRDEDAFKISNPALMIGFLTSLRSEITKAVSKIEDELLIGL